MSDTMPASGGLRVAYILKRYPRLSETFIVNEILSLEAAGAGVQIFAAALPKEDITHPAVGRVQAEVTYTRRVAARLFKHEPAVLGRECGEPATFTKLLAEARRCGDEAIDELAQAAFIASLLRQRPVDHLHAHFATSAARVARLVSKLTGVPFSFTAHAKDIFVDTVDWESVRRLLREATFTVAISDYHADFLASREPSARTVVVRNGVDLGRFRPAEGGAAARPNLVLAVGRLVEKKGFPYLLAACALLRDRGVAFECVVVGDGPQRELLDETAAGLNLNGTVRLLGARDQEFVRQTLNEAAVLVAPCVRAENGDRDGLPTVLLEAMAAGVPVVSTPVTAIPELVTDGETGVLTAERDAVGLADAIQQLLESPEHRTRLAAAGRTRVQKCHDTGRNSRQLLAAFAGSPA